MSIPGPASPPVLSLRSVSKAFGAVQALRDVTVDCHTGEIHALVGENGSGKSTLLGIASGFVHPDEGTVEIGGALRRRGSPAEARRLGLGMAYQTYSHVLALSVAENLYLAAPSDEQPAYGSMEDWAAAKLREYELDVPVTAPAGSLSLAQRQLLEVVKALLAQSEGLAPRRADDGTRARGGGAPPRPRVRAEPRRGRHRLRQPSAAGGTRHRRPHHRPARRRRPGHVRGHRHVGGEPRRADDRPAAPACVPGAPGRRGQAGSAPGRVGLAGRPVRPDRPGGREGRDRRNRRCRGQRAGAVPARPGRCRAHDRQRELRRRPARLAVAARAAARRRGAAQRRSNGRVALPRSERARQRDDPGAGAAGTPRLHQPPARAANDRRSRAPSRHPDGVRSSSRCSPCPAETSKRSR